MKTDDGHWAMQQAVSELKIAAVKARAALSNCNAENSVFERLAERLETIEKLTEPLGKALQHMCQEHQHQLAEHAIAEERLRNLAYCDDLTGLPNRAMLRDRLQQVIAQADRHGIGFALVFLDLDGFKNINDTQGHVTGDKLLQAVAERLTASVRAGDTVSRYGGDEFILVLVDIAYAADAARIAENVLTMVSMPYRIDSHELVLTASTGIALYPSHGRCINTLICCADVAMLHSKSNGRNQYQFATEPCAQP